MVKAIIFDFFDVIRSDPYNAWLKKRNLIRSGDYLRASEQLDSGRIEMPAFFSLLANLDGTTAESVDDEFKAITTINYEVLELIEHLKPRYKIALVSNSPSAPLRAILDDNNLNHYFDEIVISSEVGYIKPHKEIFDVILDRLRLSAPEVIFTDDSKQHIAGAQRVGITSIQFINAVQLKYDLQNLGIT